MASSYLSSTSLDMDALRESCEGGEPYIVLNEEREEYNDAKQLLLDNNYEPDLVNPNAFIKAGTSNDVVILGSGEQPPVFFSTAIHKPQYAPYSGHRSSKGSSVPYQWKRCKVIQVDTSKHPQNDQIYVPSSEPLDSLPLNEKQCVKIQLKIQPDVHNSETNLVVRLQPTLLQIGVDHHYSSVRTPTDEYLGYYPCFAQMALVPIFTDFSTVSLPTFIDPAIHRTEVGIPASGSEDQFSRPRPAGRKTVTKLGFRAGWGPIELSGERSWEVESEAKHSESLVPVTLDEDGNAAGLEWSLLRWSDNTKYNAKTPHVGHNLRMPKPPFSGGRSTKMRRESFPVAEWHIDWDELGRHQTCVKFSVQIVVEMHLICSLSGNRKLFKSLKSYSSSFWFNYEFDVEF